MAAASGLDCVSVTQRLPRRWFCVIGIAFEMARSALKFESQTYVAHEAIAKRIIALAKEGVIDPDQLCKQALNDLWRRLPPRV
jgi:hypothetical protein